MKKFLSVLLVILITMFCSSCGNKSTTSNSKSNQYSVTLFDYCPTLDAFIRLMEENEIDVIDYKESEDSATWFTNKELTEYIIVQKNKKNLVYKVQATDDCDALYSYLSLIPNATTKKIDLNSLFSKNTISSDDVVDGKVIYTDISKFDDNGITYEKIIKRTSSETLLSFISVECKNFNIDPVKYPDLIPNLKNEEFYRYATKSFDSKDFKSALFYFDCAKDFKDSKQKANECAYKLAEIAYQENDLINSGKYAKLAEDYSGAKDILSDVTQKLYNEINNEFNQYIESGNTDNINVLREKINACDIGFKDIGKIEQILSALLNTYDHELNNLLSDSRVSSFVQKFRLVEFLKFDSVNLYPGGFAFWATIDKHGNASDCLSIQYDELYLSYYTGLEFVTSSDYNYDEYCVPNKLSDYSIDNGSFKVKNKEKFKIEIKSKDEIVFTLSSTGEKCTLYRTNSDIYNELTKSDQEW